MKVNELIAVLQRYDQEAEVQVTWEGIFRELESDNVYECPENDRLKGLVLIDADGNFYKPRFGGVSK
jgi:hypothetical protein